MHKTPLHTCAGGDDKGLLVKSSSINEDINLNAGGIAEMRLQEKSKQHRFFSLLSSKMNKKI